MMSFLRQLVFAFICIQGSAMAESVLPQSQTSLPWLLTISSGPTWQQGGKSQTFNLTPAIEKTYSTDKQTRHFADSEVFFALQKQLNNTLYGQFGVGVGFSSNTKLSGYIWDDADPQFANLSYNYNLKRSKIALKGKILLERELVVTPWFSANLGLGINRASSFNNTPLICEAIANPAFISRTKNGFTYGFGAGLQKTLSEHIQVGLGYEFTDWGKSQFHRAPGQIENQGLGLSHLYTNGLLFNLTYLAQG